MEGGIIHHKNRPFCGVFPTAQKKILNKLFKNNGIRGTTENSGQNNTILGICREYLIALIMVKLGDLYWCNTRRRPARASKSYSFVTARFINEY
jgi:hypothetical protein